MIDPIDCRISSGTPVHILQDARYPNPLRLGGLALRIVPPFSRLLVASLIRNNAQLQNGAKRARMRPPSEQDTGSKFWQRGYRMVLVTATFASSSV
jgi:hypothetical protein